MMAWTSLALIWRSMPRRISLPLTRACRFLICNIGFSFSLQILVEDLFPFRHAITCKRVDDFSSRFARLSRHHSADLQDRRFAVARVNGECYRQGRDNQKPAIVKYPPFPVGVDPQFSVDSVRCLRDGLPVESLV